MERGERQPTVRVLFKLAAALQVTPARLIQLTQDMAEQDLAGSP